MTCYWTTDRFLSKLVVLFSLVLFGLVSFGLLLFGPVLFGPVHSVDSFCFFSVFSIFFILQPSSASIYAKKNKNNAAARPRKLDFRSEFSTESAVLLDCSGINILETSGEAVIKKTYATPNK